MGSRVRLAGPVIGLLLAVLSCRPLDGGGGLPSPEPSPSPTGPEATPAAVTAADLARATVQILALESGPGGLEPVWSGSGSVISPDGLILTNAHVVDDRADDYSHLGVAILHRSDQPPELSYLAEIAAVDYALDLAVIRIVSDLAGNPVRVELPFVALGDSNAVEIGDRLQILGYPGIGGDTITFTEGAVSGFTAERSIEGRAWIKTDATIAGGNSGGLGANALGLLIGVPSRISPGTEPGEGDVVDCRRVADTNRDGTIDDRDTCVPIGGFINGLRPVNLALPLIEAARAGTEYVSQLEPPARPSGGFDVEQVILSNLRFSNGVTADDQPLQVLQSLPSGSTHACAFWDYEGMADGMAWSAYWFIDLELNESGSTLNQTWSGGPAGTWWACIYDTGGLLDGTYEVVLEVESETRRNDAVFVGDNHPPVEFTLVNQSGTEIWYVYLSPSQARNWGQDELGPTETIDAGSSRTFSIPAGTYDLRVDDPEHNILVEEYGLDLSQGGSFVYGAAGAQPTPGAPTVHLINQSALPICYVFASPSTQTSWGGNWLEPGQRVPAGGRRDFAMPTGQNYDFQARGCDQQVLDERYGVMIPASGVTWTVGP